MTAGNVDELIEDLIAAGPQDPAYQDERIPYWAEVWPSSVALAEHVLAGDAVTADSRVIEIGCGLGLAGLAAVQKRADVLFTDYQEDALAFVELNGLTHFGRAPATALMDWREPNVARRFDVILAADVAYEKRWFAPLVRTFRRLLHPRGTVLLSEPGRRLAEGFFAMLDEDGFRWSVAQTQVSIRGTTTSVSVYEIGLPGA